ncbi:XRE family transcriptional regulator [Tritonibacter mobilis]|uniref:XRE family transcriptional regulator n=1 Tax=Tritonibacter mobilis TaxID=379347 RepID=UPI000A6F3917|nr:LexA family transcriptional regulator [Tritonibacter mobilis]
MTDIGEKIRDRREALGLSRRLFGESVGIAEAKVQAIEIGKQRIDHEALSSISRFLRVDANWLLGIEANLGDSSSSTGGDAFPAAEFVQIARYEVEASAGNGSEVASEDAAQSYAFNRKWLGKRGLKPDTLSVISVRGDSMEPDLNDGDLVLIDLANTDLSDGKIYAVQYSGNLFVKRIQYVPGDTVRLVSRNAQYAPIEIKTPEADGVRVVGRVVASMHEW